MYTEDATVCLLYDCVFLTQCWFRSNFRLKLLNFYDEVIMPFWWRHHKNCKVLQKRFMNDYLDQGRVSQWSDSKWFSYQSKSSRSYFEKLPNWTGLRKNQKAWEETARSITRFIYSSVHILAMETEPWPWHFNCNQLYRFVTFFF